MYPAVSALSPPTYASGDVAGFQALAAVRAA